MVSVDVKHHERRSVSADFVVSRSLLDPFRRAAGAEHAAVVREVKDAVRAARGRSETNLSPLCAASHPVTRLYRGKSRKRIMNIKRGPFKTIRVQELCESRGGRPGLSVLTVSVDVKQH